MEAAAILFTVLLAFMEIRHAVNDGDVYRQSAGLTEVALQVCVALAMAIGLERLRIRTGSVIHNVGAILLTVFAGLAAVFGLLLLENPMLWSIDVGGVVHQPAAARLRPARGAGAAVVLCRGGPASGRLRQHDRGRRARSRARLCDVRNPADFITARSWSTGPTTGAEQYTYSIAWLAFGVVLLGIGILFNSQRARLASAVVIALTILKAFLIDMSTLTGVYRALSFMCLGLVLVAIGWLYQRILFRRQAAAPAAPGAPAGGADRVRPP